MFFPVVMYGCESWTVKKAEWWRIDAFELWCWRRVLRVPWTARRSNQSIAKEIGPKYSLEGLMLKVNTLATWCEELTQWKRPWCWEGLKVGVEGDNRGWGGWMASPTQWTRVWVSSGSWWWKGKPGVLQSMGSQRIRHDWATEWLPPYLWWFQVQSCWSRNLEGQVCIGFIPSKCALPLPTLGPSTQRGPVVEQEGLEQVLSIV